MSFSKDEARHPLTLSLLELHVHNFWVGFIFEHDFLCTAVAAQNFDGANDTLRPRMNEHLPVQRSTRDVNNIMCTFTIYTIYFLGKAIVDHCSWSLFQMKNMMIMRFGERK